MGLNCDRRFGVAKSTHEEPSSCSPIAPLIVHVDSHEVLHVRANERPYVYVFLSSTAKNTGDVVTLSSLQEHIVPRQTASATPVAALKTLITKVNKLMSRHDELQIAVEELQKETGELKDMVGKKRKRDEGQPSSAGAAQPSSPLAHLGCVSQHLQQLQQMLGHFAN